MIIQCYRYQIQAKVNLYLFVLGAFLIPYLFFLFVCGLPLFFMETAIGQSTGLSTVRIFNMIPFASGESRAKHFYTLRKYVKKMEYWYGLGFRVTETKYHF